MDKMRIKQRLRRTLLAFRWGRALFRFRASFRARRFLPVGDRRQIFQNCYENNWWGNSESVSGPGSTAEYTANIREMIPRLVEELGVQVILDAPCGDYNWFRMIEWRTPIGYIGGDIVGPLVRRNQESFGTEDTVFVDLDILSDPLPTAGLWLCRDCLFHLSDREIFLALDNFLRSDIPYILTSTYSDSDINFDIPTGSFRPLNLQLPPFCLSSPTILIDDWIEGFEVRHLALWKRESVRDDLASNKAFRKATGRNL